MRSAGRPSSHVGVGLDRQVVTCLFCVPVGDVFKGLADPTRRAILDELRDKSGQTLFELCGRLMTKHGLASSRQAISQHLDILEEAGLVKSRREGRYKFHDLDTTPLRAITERWGVLDDKEEQDEDRRHKRPGG